MRQLNGIYTQARRHQRVEDVQIPMVQRRPPPPSLEEIAASAVEYSVSTL